MTALPQFLRDATATLAAVSETPRLDAELLAAHALGISRSQMLLGLAEHAVPNGLAEMLQRRLQHEPVAYITGWQAFWNLELAVTPDVLIPRSDSETLIEVAIEAFASRPPHRILDMGTGSGALLLAALSVFPDATGVAIDASAAALGVARGNAKRLGFGGRSQWREGSWHDSGWHDSLSEFDLIMCNPPYIENDAALSEMVARYEPHRALFAGPDGLDDYAVLLPQIPALLAPGGVALFEIGSNQAGAVGQLAAVAGLSTELHRDLTGKPRVLRFSLGIEMANG